MRTDRQIYEISPGVTWVGVLDPDLVTFDVVMETKYGTTYNAYFIDAELKTLVDTVKAPFWPVFRAKLEQVTDPSQIRYIIVNHTEPDHSGCLPELLRLAPEAVVVGTGNAVRYLKDQLGGDFPHRIVKDGDHLDLGDRTLTFIGAPNLHWPDTMYTWLEEDRLLFTCDSFGCHYAHPAMFDDAVGDFDDAFLYYYNVILKPYSRFMVKAIDKISGLPVRSVCPGHGPVLRKDWEKYVRWSRELAEDALHYPVPGRVLIAYVSAYKNTAAMAAKIAEGIRDASPDLDAVLCDLEGMSFGEMEEQVTAASGIIAGSPLINQNILLQLYQLFAVINPIRDRGKPAGAFGSFGWSADFMKNLETNLMNLRLNYVGGGVFVRFTPHEGDLQACYEYGRQFGLKMIEDHEKCAE